MIKVFQTADCTRFKIESKAVLKAELSLRKRCIDGVIKQDIGFRAFGWIFCAVWRQLGS